MPYIAELSLTAGLAGLFLAAYVWSENNRLRRLLNKLFAETGHEEFGDVLLSHQRQLRRNQETLRSLTQQLEHLQNESHFLLNQVGLVRYNPFPSSGGNMSFSMALLNDNGDGVVITSLHSREGVRIYAKGVKQFSGEQTLMEEEKEAIAKAKRQDNV